MAVSATPWHESHVRRRRAVAAAFRSSASRSTSTRCSQGALSDAVRAAYEEYLDGWDAHGAEWEHWVERVRGGAGSVRRRCRRRARRRRDPDVGLRRRQRARQRAPLRRRAEPDRDLRVRVSDHRPDRARAGAARAPRSSRSSRDPEAYAAAVDERTALVARRSSPTARARCTTSSRSTGSRASTGR